MSNGVLIKQPSESDIYDIDFSPILRADDDIASVISVIADPSGLVIGPPTFSGQVVQVRISEGVHKILYRISVVITSVANNTKEIDVLLRVID